MRPHDHNGDTVRLIKEMSKISVECGRHPVQANMQTKRLASDCLANESFDDIVASWRWMLTSDDEHATFWRENRPNQLLPQNFLAKNKSDVLNVTLHIGAMKQSKALPDFEFPDGLDTPEFREQWGRWLKHRREIGKSLSSVNQQELIAVLADRGPSEATERIKRAILNGWSQLFTKDELIPAESRVPTDEDLANWTPE